MEILKATNLSKIYQTGESYFYLTLALRIRKVTFFVPFRAKRKRSRGIYALNWCQDPSTRFARSG